MNQHSQSMPRPQLDESFFTPSTDLSSSLGYNKIVGLMGSWLNV